MAAAVGEGGEVGRGGMGATIGAMKMGVTWGEVVELWWGCDGVGLMTGLRRSS